MTEFETKTLALLERIAVSLEEANKRLERMDTNIEHMSGFEQRAIKRATAHLNFPR